MKDSDEEPALPGLSSSELNELLRAGRPRALPPYSILCEEGQLTNHCFLITEGTIEISKTIGGTHHALAKHGPGSILALMATLDGGPCRVSMRAAEETKVVEIPRDGLCDIFGAGDAPAGSLIQKMAITAIRRLRRSTDELAQAIHRSITAVESPGRIATSDLAMIHAGNHAWKAEA